ncbi:hypothetical protein ABZ783_24970 [Micromonospora sp. NPDC047738]|uniref:hypothetical protein n=1 Tax=Micromonospora sp. NPDC047738 TaxID=3155741 RepID=UPI0033F2EA10
MSEIRAKVAAIVSEHQLALNLGSNNGVEVDDVVEVIREVEVDDPDTKERLGVVRLIRLRLKVNHVQEKLCVALVTDQYVAQQTGVGLASLVPNRRLKKVTSTYKEGQVGEFCVITLGETAVIKKKEPAEKERSDD